MISEKMNKRVLYLNSFLSNYDRQDDSVLLEYYDYRMLRSLANVFNLNETQMLNVIIDHFIEKFASTYDTILSYDDEKNEYYFLEPIHSSNSIDHFIKTFDYIIRKGGDKKYQVGFSSMFFRVLNSFIEKGIDLDTLISYSIWVYYNDLDRYFKEKTNMIKLSMENGDNNV